MTWGAGSSSKHVTFPPVLHPVSSSLLSAISCLHVPDFWGSAASTPVTDIPKGVLGLPPSTACSGGVRCELSAFPPSPRAGVCSPGPPHSLSFCGLVALEVLLFCNLGIQEVGSEDWEIQGRHCPLSSFKTCLGYKRLGSDTPHSGGGGG